MKVQWDYTKLADAYLKRPDYSDDAVDEMLRISGLLNGGSVCDVGAGVGHLSIMLAKRGINVVAVEPNESMRTNGINRTLQFNNIKWCIGTGEETGQQTDSFDLATFGSSFNVVDRPEALKETVRILKKSGWFACMWNHRELKDDIQARIESIISTYVPDYDYGARREDQTDIINRSGLFEGVHRINGTVTHVQAVSDCVEAWRSHATLRNQSGDMFGTVISEIEKMLYSLGQDNIKVPYTTVIWLAKTK